MKQSIEDTYHWDRLYVRETYWAQLYHDGIRGRKHLEQLSLNIGNWAGNYCMMYLLNRLLHEHDFKTIVEMGLGESTKMILAYLGSHKGKVFVNIEHDKEWLTLFKQNNHSLVYDASQENSIVLNISPIVLKTVSSAISEFPISSNSYFGNDEAIPPIVLRANLYIVDGPLGSHTFGRPDFIRIAEEMDADHQFVAIFDDCNREPEQQSFAELERVLQYRGIEYVTRKDFVGLKTVYVLATKQQYGYIATM